VIIEKVAPGLARSGVNPYPGTFWIKYFRRFIFLAGYLFRSANITTRCIGIGLREFTAFETFDIRRMVNVIIVVILSPQHIITSFLGIQR
jgi:hypothetical protein